VKLSENNTLRGKLNVSISKAICINELSRILNKKLQTLVKLTVAVMTTDHNSVT